MNKLALFPVIAVAGFAMLACSKVVGADKQPSTSETTDHIAAIEPARKTEPPTEINPAMLVQERQAGDNPDQKYFLIQHKETEQTTARHGLLLILPGGPGTRDFLPFCANVLAQYGLPKDFLAAELVAPQWSKDENRAVWPSRMIPDKLAKFTSEDFLSAVIADVKKSSRVDERFIFTLGWSSSGHVLYSASLSNPEITGSVVCMSRFMPNLMPAIDEARGKNYFLYHSPEDQICPFRESQLAERMLREHGARTKLVSYKGGHGWVPNTYYCDRIKEGVIWLKECNSEKGSGTTRSENEPLKK